MWNIENTAVNDLIARASGGRRAPSGSMADVGDDPDGDSDAEPGQLTLPVAMPVAAPFSPRRSPPATPAASQPVPVSRGGARDPFGDVPEGFEARRASASYPVAHRGPAVAAAPEWPPATAPEFLEPTSPRQLYELASRVEQGEVGVGTRGPGFDRERMVPTFQMRRHSEVRSVVGKLVFPIALLVSVGIVIGAYVAFSGDRGATREDLTASAGVAAPAQAPVAAPAPPAAPIVRPVPSVSAMTEAAPAAIPAPAAAPVPAAAAAAVAAAPASELVDVRIDSVPPGATVMLVDRGRTQLIGDTPVDTALDPSREYDLVFTSASAPPHVEHVDPRTTRRVEVALGKREAGEHAAVEPPPAEHAPAEHAPADHAPARTSRPRPEPRAEVRAEPAVGQGTLMISSKPPCEIVIDGRSTGLTTPQRSIALSAGSHRITLLNPEKSIHKVVSVQILANTTAKIIEDLMQ